MWLFLRPETPPTLRFEVFRGGRPLFERAPGEFAAGAARALAMYEDALPFRRRLREMLIEEAGRS